MSCPAVTLLPLPADAHWRRTIRLVATDMDGTLTRAGQFSVALMQDFERLRSVGIRLWIVTGRSAGWVSGLATYLPIDGAIAENGGVFYSAANDAGTMLVPLTDVTSHRRQLRLIFEQLQLQFPHITESSDNVFRLTDWTFDNRQLSPAELTHMGQWCERQGWGFTHSSIQCHIKPVTQSKGNAILRLLESAAKQSTDASPVAANCMFNDPTLQGLTSHDIVTVGDSPNDESLFDVHAFPYSVGVANLRHYKSMMAELPTYLTVAEAGDGFSELVTWLLSDLTAS